MSRNVKCWKISSKELARTKHIGRVVRVPRVAEDLREVKGETAGVRRHPVRWDCVVLERLSHSRFTAVLPSQENLQKDKRRGHVAPVSRAPGPS